MELQNGYTELGHYCCTHNDALSIAYDLLEKNPDLYNTAHENLTSLAKDYIVNDENLQEVTRFGFEFDVTADGVSVTNDRLSDLDMDDIESLSYCEIISGNDELSGKIKDLIRDYGYARDDAIEEARRSWVDEYGEPEDTFDEDNVDLSNVQDNFRDRISEVTAEISRVVREEAEGLYESTTEMYAMGCMVTNGQLDEVFAIDPNGKLVMIDNIPAEQPKGLRQELTELAAKHAKEHKELDEKTKAFKEAVTEAAPKINNELIQTIENLLHDKGLESAKEEKVKHMNEVCDRIEKIDPVEFANAYTEDQIREFLENSFVPFNTKYGVMELDLEDGRVEFEGVSMGGNLSMSGNNTLYQAIKDIREIMQAYVEEGFEHFSKEEKDGNTLPYIENLPNRARYNVVDKQPRTQDEKFFAKVDSDRRKLGLPVGNKHKGMDR